MKRFPALAALFACVAAIACLTACGTDEPDLPRLEFPGTMPREVKIGDTTAVIELVKYYADPRGREQTNKAFKSYTFKSSDAAVLAVVDGNRLTGLKDGSVTVTATDNIDNGSATRTGVTVSVKPK